jgi:hypothetical protein
MNPDILIHVKFKTTEEGGRKSPLQKGIYSCPMIIDQEAFDCRILIKDDLVKLGQFYEFQVKFLNYSLVEKNISIGKKIALWEGKEVAVGVVKAFAM